MDQLIFTLVIVVFVVMEVFDFMVSFLNDKAKGRTVPKNVQDVYDDKSYQTWLNYNQEHARLRMIKSIGIFLIILILLLSGGFSALANHTIARFDSVYLETLSFIGILYLGHFIYGIGFNIYATFSIEERYGFNKTTPAIFIKDKIKSVLLTIVIGGGLLILIQLFYETFDALFLVVSFIVVMVIFLLINMLYVKVFVPLFNTLTPLEDGALKQKIEALAKKEAYTVQNIHVMDASKRSTKLNAFFSGFGKFKNVVLFDTLIEKMDEDAILSVLAHEIGHAKHKDVLRNIAFSAINLLVMLSLLWLFLTRGEFMEAFGVEGLHFGFALILFSILLGPINLLISMMTSILSRKAEYKADYFGSTRVSKEAMKRALKILSKENFSNLTPHPLYVFLHYSHPPVSDRIQAIDQI